MAQVKKEKEIVKKELVAGENDFLTGDSIEAEKVQKQFNVMPEVSGSSMYFSRKYIFRGIKDKANTFLGKK